MVFNVRKKHLIMLLLVIIFFAVIYYIGIVELFRNIIKIISPDEVHLKKRSYVDGYWEYK